MQLITDEYRRLNEQKHKESLVFGTKGHKYADEILNLCSTYKTTDVLDYGCGKNTLAQSLPFIIKKYDPAIKQYSQEPEPADIVTCTDVMEHIEPDCLDSVLKHMASKTKKAAYFTICTVPAKKHLADGRNAHLIVEGTPFWVKKLDDHFEIVSVLKMDFDLIVICTPKKPKETK